MALLKRKRTGMNDAMSVVTRFVNACNRHDADGVYACLHPDFDSIQPMFPSRNFRGADQVRRNWQAIFDAEPGFRLTVLRSASTDDTAWLELHGAGRDAEVAGVFIMGIQSDRVRWARIYSALVEPVPATADEGSAPSGQLQEVPPLEEVPASNGEVVEEALIAPVVDIERTGRRRRRSARRRGAEQAAQVAPVEEAPAGAPEVQADADFQPEAAAEVVEPVSAGDEPEVVAAVVTETEDEVVPEPPVEPEPPVGPEPEVVAEADTAVVAEEPRSVDVVEDAADLPPEVEAAAEILEEPEPEAVAEPVPVPEVVAEPVAEAEAEVDKVDEVDEVDKAADAPPPWTPPKRRFGKKSR